MADLIQHDELRAIFGPEMPIIAVKLLWTPDKLTVDELRQLLRAIAALPAQGVRVKPLEWELRAGKDGPFYSAFDPVVYCALVEAPDEDACDDIDRKRAALIGRILAALDTPAPALMAELVEAAKGVTASLAAAVSLLERGGKAAKKAAPSDTMFDQMLKDYRKALEASRAVLAKIGGA